ncbi:hypothetical protein Syun_021366 [Stephania yunnanensis]|uniref:Uncharacterized protein n=1 Tax=Stephania yunnanensis TaxID=152371 RepID=A0AAP0IFH3_9MAGN
MSDRERRERKKEQKKQRGGEKEEGKRVIGRSGGDATVGEEDAGWSSGGASETATPAATPTASRGGAARGSSATPVRSELAEIVPAGADGGARQWTPARGWTEGSGEAPVTPAVGSLGSAEGRTSGSAQAAQTAQAAQAAQLRKAAAVAGWGTGGGAGERPAAAARQRRRRRRRDSRGEAWWRSFDRSISRFRRNRDDAMEGLRSRVSVRKSRRERIREFRVPRTSSEGKAT